MPAREDRTAALPKGTQEQALPAACYVPPGLRACAQALQRRASGPRTCELEHAPRRKQRVFRLDVAVYEAGRVHREQRAHQRQQHRGHELVLRHAAHRALHLVKEVALRWRVVQQQPVSSVHCDAMHCVVCQHALYLIMRVAQQANVCRLLFRLRAVLHGAVRR